MLTECEQLLQVNHKLLLLVSWPYDLVPTPLNKAILLSVNFFI